MLRIFSQLSLSWRSVKYWIQTILPKIRLEGRKISYLLEDGKVKEFLGKVFGERKLYISISDLSEEMTFPVGLAKSRVSMRIDH